MSIPWSRVTLRFGKQTECAFVEMQNARLMSQDQQVSAQQCVSLDNNCCWLNMLCSIHLIQVKVPPPRCCGLCDGPLPVALLLFFPVCVLPLQWSYLQAATIYLTMVASGSLLYLLICTFIPSRRLNNIDDCSSLIICSWLGPAAHLTLLQLLPAAAYQRHRTAVTVGLRAFYLLATTINGFGRCGVGSLAGPYSTQSSSYTTSSAAPSAAILVASGQELAGSMQLETLFSAFLWRSGLIGLLWYAGGGSQLLFPSNGPILVMCDHHTSLSL